MSIRTGSLSWAKVRAGLGNSYLGLCLVVVALVVGLLASLALIPRLGPEWSRVLGWSFMGLIVAGLAGRLLDLVGRVRCLAVPVDFPARRSLSVAIALQVAGLALLLAYYFWPKFSEWGQLAAAGMQWVNILSPLVFLTFLWGVARDLGRRDLAEVAAQVQRWGILLAVSFLVVSAVAVMQLRVGSMLVLIQLAIMGAGVLVFVNYATLLVDLRRAIALHLELVARKEEDEGATWHAPGTAEVKQKVQGEFLDFGEGGEDGGTGEGVK